MKYIYKENELSSILTNIIREEISRSKKLNEGLWQGLKNIARVGATAVLNPAYSFSKSANWAENFLSPTGNETLKSSYRDLKNFLGFEGGNKNKNKKENSGKKNTEQQEKQKASESEAVNKSDIRKKYGEPETVGNMGSRLTEKEDIIIDDFLGSGKSETFKKHYKEKNQERSNSIFNKKLEVLKKDCGYNSERGKKLFETWLVERDSAYEKYIKG